MSDSSPPSSHIFLCYCSHLKPRSFFSPFVLCIVVFTKAKVIYDVEAIVAS